MQTLLQILYIIGAILAVIGGAALTVFSVIYSAKKAKREVHSSTISDLDYALKAAEEKIKAQQGEIETLTMRQAEGIKERGQLKDEVEKIKDEARNDREVLIKHQIELLQSRATLQAEIDRLQVDLKNSSDIKEVLKNVLTTNKDSGG